MHLWRAINNMLPTYSWLYNHRLRNDALCPWGCGQEESIDHMLGGCSFISKIKSEGTRLGIPSSILGQNLLEFIMSDLLISNDPAIASFIASITYFIWRSRNCMIHGEPYMQPASIVINALLDASRGHWSSPCNHQSIWTTPPVGWIKINFDGSVLENCIAGLGCTIRDDKGELIAAIGLPHRSRSVSMTEFIAARAGLTLASQHSAGFLGAILEGDSADACGRISRILEGYYMGERETSMARLLLNFPRLVLSQVNRKANSAADHLAKNACYSEFQWERGMPLTTVFSQILVHDANLV